MQINLLKKGLVIGIIILFIGASFTTSISGNIKDLNKFYKEKLTKYSNHVQQRFTNENSITSVPPTSGDWIITNVESFGDQTINLTGNLTITSTGHLTLYNVTLIMNCSYSGEFKIQVNSSGRLDIKQNSIIKCNNSAFTYKFLVYGYLNISQSTIKWTYGDTITGGIQLFPTSHVRINNSIIKDSETHGIYVNGSSPKIYDNILTDLAVLYKSVYFGIYVENGASPTISGNNITMMHGIYCNQSAANIINNTIMGTNGGGFGIKVEDCTSNLIIANNTFIHKRYATYLLRSSPVIENNYYYNDIFFPDPIDHGAQILSYDHSSPKIVGNTIENYKTSRGIICEYAPATTYIANNTIILLDNPDVQPRPTHMIGIQMADYSDGIVENNKLYGGGFIYTTGSLHITEHSYPTLRNNTIQNFCNWGLTIHDSSPIIENNTISKGGWGGINVAGDSGSTIIRNNVIKNMGLGIQIHHNNPIIINNTIQSWNNSKDYEYCDIFVWGPHVTVINTTFNKTKVWFYRAGPGGSPGSLTAKWYMNVKTVDVNLTPVTNANLVVKNVTDDEIYNGTTDAKGERKWILCTEFNGTYIGTNIWGYMNNTTSHTPHNTTANTSSLIGFAYPKPIINASKKVHIIMGNGTGTIRGTVNGVIGGTTVQLANATVSIGFEHSTLTNSTGEFQMPVPAGTLNVTASAINYTNQTHQVTVTDGGITIVNFSLTFIDWWPMFHHDLQRSGYSTSDAPDTDNLLWSYTTGDWVSSSPAVEDGKVYIGSFDNNVYCLDASNGSKIWNYTTGDYVYSSPAVADGKVYIGSNDYNVYCLDADNGSKIWNYTTGYYMLYSSPVVADNKVYIGSFDNNVYCLDADNGSKIWNYTTGDYMGPSSPAVCNGKVYIGAWDYKVYCLDADNGSKIWNYTTGDMVQSSPAIADDKVYIGSYDNNVYCLDADNGSMIWYYTTGIYGIYSSPAITDDKVYIGSNDNNVYCLNASDGSKIWNYTTGDWVYSSPAIADGKLYIGSINGKVYCFGYNHNPDAPSINGPLNGVVGTEYKYTFNSIDPDDNDILEYVIDWGDESGEETITGPYDSGEEATGSHYWTSQKTFTIKAKAKDIYGAESNWSEFKVEIPRYNAVYHSLLLWLFERFPLLERLLTLIRLF